MPRRSRGRRLDAGPVVVGVLRDAALSQLGVDDLAAATRACTSSRELTPGRARRRAEPVDVDVTDAHVALAACSTTSMLPFVDMSILPELSVDAVRRRVSSSVHVASTSV